MKPAHAPNIDPSRKTTANVMRLASPALVAVNPSID
jgi:hypothetical protein